MRSIPTAYSYGQRRVRFYVSHRLFVTKLTVFAGCCCTADLTAKKLMEGNSVIQCRALQGKMINGDEIDISAAHVAVDAVYGARTNIEASDDITVGLCRGMIEVSGLIVAH
jgi:hypothetical protein